MGGNELLTAREFYKGIERLEARFDNVGIQLVSHAERLAVLEAERQQTERTTKKRATAWGSAVAGAVMLAVEAIKAFVK